MRSICTNFYDEIFNRNWLKDARVVDKNNIYTQITNHWVFLICLLLK